MNDVPITGRLVMVMVEKSCTTRMDPVPFEIFIALTPLRLGWKIIYALRVVLKPLLFPRRSGLGFLTSI